MSSEARELIQSVEAFSDDPAMAARQLRFAALELLDEVNRLERENPSVFLDFQGREWHIARYESEASA